MKMTEIEWKLISWERHSHVAREISEQVKRREGEPEWAYWSWKWNGIARLVSLISHLMAINFMFNNVDYLLYDIQSGTIHWPSNRYARMYVIEHILSYQSVSLLISPILPSYTRRFTSFITIRNYPSFLFTFSLHHTLFINIFLSQ